MSDTYANVDGSRDPRQAVAWQRRIDGWPQIQAYKACVRAHLGPCDPVLDVGCGPGGDLATVETETSRFMVGVDASAAMCLEASHGGAVVGRGDAHALPFATGSFGGVSADRVLQHIDHPGDVVREMLRVLRTGGRLVVVDPDQETLSIHLPGVRQDLLDRVKALRRDIGYRNGRLAAQLPSLLTSLGLVDITVDGFALTLTDPDVAFGLPTWIGFWRQAGGFTDEDEREWHDGIDRGRQGGFVYSVTYLVVSATKG